ncbi:hypothetical protein SCLCIDRAFT_1210172 [Scleroderma citrinum Foug A]|uniref:Uncharacterized protein n=1 Tax=Scleroderma citrinum Foug A TaxID=1036808 RepID=A0A0C3EGR8_9AGAM|nr:hypothetical protein SCLCIDRAFT_1210172 [Scleroderma citrinum Foug A]
MPSSSWAQIQSLVETKCDVYNYPPDAFSLGFACAVRDCAHAIISSPSYRIHMEPYA